MLSPLAPWRQGVRVVGCARQKRGAQEGKEEGKVLRVLCCAGFIER
jgi:hypothetical protein